MQLARRRVALSLLRACVRHSWEIHFFASGQTQCNRVHFIVFAIETGTWTRVRAFHCELRHIFLLFFSHNIRRPFKEFGSMKMSGSCISRDDDRWRRRRCETDACRRLIMRLIFFISSLVWPAFFIRQFIHVTENMNPMSSQLVFM